LIVDQKQLPVNVPEWAKGLAECPTYTSRLFVLFRLAMAEAIDERPAFARTYENAWNDHRDSVDGALCRLGLISIDLRTCDLTFVQLTPLGCQLAAELMAVIAPEEYDELAERARAQGWEG